MIRLSASIKKEFLLLSRDVHALLVLFIMPAIFILIMSFAMQDGLSSQGKISITISLINLDQSNHSEQLIKNLMSIDQFRWDQLSPESLESQKQALLADKVHFVVVIEKGFADDFTIMEEYPDDSDDNKQNSMTLWIGPSVKLQTRMLMEATINQVYLQTKLNHEFGNLQLFGEEREESDDTLNNIDLANQKILKTRYISQGKQEIIPSAVQQSVPAWLIFSMFFVVIPVSSTFIREKQQGTFIRLSTMNIPIHVIFIGKIIPYFLINQIQLIAMILVGMYVVPFIGGDTLTLGDSIAGLVVMSSAVSFAALGFALLISVITQTTEQANTLGGLSNIILAAIGGIMVPKFIMPPVMQQLTIVSPMSWGLEGFLDIFLRHGHITQVLPEATALLIFGILAIILAIWRFRVNIVG